MSVSINSAGMASSLCDCCALGSAFIVLNQRQLSLFPSRYDFEALEEELV